jgi:gas vesicle protein
MNNFKVIATVAAGMLAGVALGFILAPEKGKKTRSRLLEGARDISDSVKKKLHNETEAIS